MAQIYIPEDIKTERVSYFLISYLYFEDRDEQTESINFSRLAFKTSIIDFWF